MIYLVINLETRERGGFETARDVAYFMWGRDLGRFRVYKRGVAVQWLDCRFAAFAAGLEAA